MIDDAHLETLETLIGQTTNRTMKRRLKELLLIVTQLHTNAMYARVLDQFAQELEAPMLEEDLQVLERLMHKGVLHNGVVPELTAPQVSRAVAMLTTLCVRANVGILEAEDQQFLEWMFDQAADADPEQRVQARRVEQIVRGGLGLEQRLLWTYKPGAPLS